MFDVLAKSFVLAEVKVSTGSMTNVYQINQYCSYRQIKPKVKAVFEFDVLVVPVLGRAITNNITGSFETINNSCPSQRLLR